MQSSHLPHDEYVQRLQTLTGTVVFERVNPDTGAVEPSFQLEGNAIIPALVISQTTLRTEIDRVTAEIMHWGRIASQSRRVWQVREREYRVWKARYELTLRKLAEDSKSKSPSKDLIEAEYRAAPEYGAVSALVERAEEAFNVAEAVYAAFRAKKDVLVADVRRAPDGSLQRLSA